VGSNARLTVVKPHAKTCLVVQLSCLGDVLQTLMSIKACKQLYPNVDYSLIVKSEYYDLIKETKWIKNIIPLSVSEFKESYKNSNEKKSVISKLAKWTLPNVQERWDFVVNWTFNDSSSYLASIFPAQVRLGYFRNEDQLLLMEDGWSYYINSVVQSNIEQNIHMTDIFTTQLLTAFQIHIGSPKKADNVAVSSKCFFSDSYDFEFQSQYRNNEWITIALDTKDNDNQYDENYWITFISKVLSRHNELNIFIVGSDKSSDMANKLKVEIEKSGVKSDLVRFFVGNHHHKNWISSLSLSQWLISNDSFFVHLASVLSTRVVCFSDKTGLHQISAYGTGNFLIKKQTKHNKTEFSSVVYATWSYGYSEWSHKHKKSLKDHFSQLGYLKFTEGLKIYRSHIRDASLGGGLDYEQMIEKSFSLEDLMKMIIGQVARKWFCGWAPPVGGGISSDLFTNKLIASLRELKESLFVLKKISIKSENICIEFKKRSSSIKKPYLMKTEDKNKILKLNDDLNQIEKLFYRTVQLHPELLFLLNSLKAFLHGPATEDLNEAVDKSLRAYQMTTEAIDVVEKWVNYSLDINKPKKVDLSNVVYLNLR